VAQFSVVRNLARRAVGLAEQASSDMSGLDGSLAKSELDDENNSILTEIDRISATVEFIGKTPLGGSDSGPSSDAFPAGSAAQDELAKLQSASDTTPSDRSTLAAANNRLQATVAVISTQAENLKAAESQIRDANAAEDLVSLTRFQVLNQTGLAALAQANVSAQSMLALLGQ